MPKTTKVKGGEPTDRQVLGYMIEYLGSLFEITNALLKKQIDVISKYEKWGNMFQKRSQDPDFWPKALEGLDSKTTGDIMFTFSALANVTASMQNAVSMAPKDRKLLLDDLAKTVKKLKAIQKSLQG